LFVVENGLGALDELDKNGYVEDESKEYVVMTGHMGYVDSEVMKLSSYHLLRVKDLEDVTSPEVLE